VLFRPWNGEPCYIGKGVGDRLNVHSATKARQHNPHLANVLKKAKRLGLEVPRVKVRENLSETEALDTEKAFINAIGRNIHGGPLTNLTDGAGGTTGHTHTPETRAKITAALKVRVRTAETYAKIAAKKRGQKHTPETLAKIKATRVGIRLPSPSEERRQKISAALKGKKHTQRNVAPT